MKDIILILILQLVYVPMNTLRVIFVVKNMSLIASILGFMEALVYVFGLAIVFSGEQSVIAMVVYALGFGVGIFVGGVIERKLAVGFVTLSVNLMNKNTELIQKLREEGFGVTVFEGEGKDSKRYQLDILAKRSREKELLAIIDEYEPRAFIVSFEPRRFQGGFLASALRKRMK